MKLTKIIMAIILVLTVSCNVQADGFFKKVISQDWVAKSYLKYGMLISTCVGQSATGLVESYQFNGRHLVTKDNYHIMRYFQSAGMLSSGYLMAANIRSKKIGFWRKGRNIFGSMLLGRNAMEWSYKANRWGNPFDYDPTHTSNQKAIVYIKFSFSEGKFVDAYIGSNRFTGPLIDMGFTVFGVLLLSGD